MELDLNKCQKYKTIQIHVDEKIYTISGIISIDDFQEILNAKKQERTDYRNIVAEIIWRRLLNVENSPRLEQIIALDDRCFLSYINATLEGCPKLQDAFIQLSDEDDVFYRFLNAVDVYWTGTVREIAKMISESFPKIHIIQTKQFAELAGSTLEAISKKIQELYRNPIRNL